MPYNTPAATGDTRTLLLKTAWHLVEKRGVAEVTLAEIAAASQVSRQAVYLHFGSRAGLLVAMVRHRDTASLKARKMVSVAKQPPSLRTIERFVRLWFGYVAEILPVARAIEAAATSDADAAAAWQDRMETLRGLIRDIVDGLAESGQLASSWTRPKATDWFWSRAHVDVWWQLAYDRKWSPEQVAGCVVDSLWRDLVGDGVR